MRGITELSLKDNEFGDEGLSSIFKGLAGGFKVTPAIRDSSSTRAGGDIVSLNVDGNFKLKSNTARDLMIGELVGMIGSSRCSKLQRLSMIGGVKSASQLREYLGSFIAAVAQSNLVELNICGHRMGYKGAVALSRTLRVNRKLKKLYWDDNSLSLEALERVVTQGLAHNETVLVCPVPVVDISAMVSSFQSDSSGGSEKIFKLQELVAQLQQTVAANHAAQAKREGAATAESSAPRSTATRNTRATSGGGSSSAKPTRKTSGPIQLAIPAEHQEAASATASPRKKKEPSPSSAASRAATARPKSGQTKKAYTTKTATVKPKRKNSEEEQAKSEASQAAHKIAASQAAGVAKRLNAVRKADSGELDREPPPAQEPANEPPALDLAESASRRKDRGSRRSGQPLKNVTMRQPAASSESSPTSSPKTKRAADDSMLFRSSSKTLVPPQVDGVRSTELDSLGDPKKGRPRSGVYGTMRPSKKSDESLTSGWKTSSTADSVEISETVSDPSLGSRPAAEPEHDPVPTADFLAESSMADVDSSKRTDTEPITVAVSIPAHESAESRDVLAGSAPEPESALSAVLAVSLSQSTSAMAPVPAFTSALSPRSGLMPAWDESGSDSDEDGHVLDDQQFPDDSAESLESVNEDSNNLASEEDAGSETDELSDIPSRRSSSATGFSSSQIMSEQVDEDHVERLDESGSVSE